MVTSIKKSFEEVKQDSVEITPVLNKVAIDTEKFTGRTPYAAWLHETLNSELRQ